MKTVPVVRESRLASAWDGLLVLIKISRPLGWFFYPGVAAIGMVYGRAEVSSAAAIALMLSFGFPYCLWTMAWNDLYDTESDRVNPRKDSWLHGGLVRPETEKLIRVGTWLSGLFPILVAPFMPIETTILSIIVYVVGMIYSVPPIRLKDIPFLDGYYSAATVWGLFAAGFSLGAPISKMPVELYFCLPAIVALHFYYTTLDYEFDLQAGHQNFVVRFGKRFTFFMAAVFTLPSVIAIPYVQYAKPVEIAIIAQFVLCVISWVFSERIPARKCMLALTLFDTVCLFAILFH